VPEDSLKEYEGKFPEEPYLGDRNYLPNRTPRATYAAMVTRMDRDIGRLLDLPGDVSDFLHPDPALAGVAEAFARELQDDAGEGGCGAAGHGALEFKVPSSRFKVGATRNAQGPSPTLNLEP